MRNNIVNNWQSAADREKRVVLAVLKRIAGKALAALCFVLVFTATAIAQGDSAMQNAPKVEMADTLRSNGKIYVVVAVLSIVLIGLFLYVIRLDRKITKLEKDH